MRKLIMGCLGVIAALAAVQWTQAEVKAGVFSDCSPCEVASCDPCEPVCGKKSLWFVSGHLEAGLFANEYGRTNDYSFGPGLAWDSGNTSYLKNAHNSDFQMNQILVNFGKKLSKRGWDVGGQVSVMYGTDARFAQSDGLEKNAGRGQWNDGDYYTAIAQMYAEVGYDNVSVKVGKFWNPMGHNPLDSSERFFYTLSDAFGILPVTQSGILATWDVNKKLSVFGGWTSGTGSYSNWHLSNTGDSFFDSSDNNAFLGGFRYAMNKRVTFGYSAMIGKDNTSDYNYGFGPRNDGQWNYFGDGRDYFIQSFIVDVKLNKKWNYTFEWTLRNEKWKNSEIYSYNPGVYYGESYKDFWGAYGINQELVYRYNKKWAFGLRAEWVHSYFGWDWTDFDEDGVDDSGHVNDSMGNKFSFVLGANWTPRPWIVVRPELRYDKFESAWMYLNKNYEGHKQQLSGGFSAMVKF